MARGPKPDPAAVKEAKGNPSRRPIGSDPAPTENADAASNVVVSVEVAPPKWLKKEGLQVWKRIAPRLWGIKILTAVDAETFARYCQNFGRWIKLQKTIAEEGEFYQTDTKFSRPHPAMMIVLRLEPILDRAEDRFGLNPAERQRIFAARAASGYSPDLFNPQQPNKNGKDDAPNNPPQKNLGEMSAVGALN